MVSPEHVGARPYMLDADLAENRLCSTVELHRGLRGELIWELTG